MFGKLYEYSTCARIQFIRVFVFNNTFVVLNLSEAQRNATRRTAHVVLNYNLQNAHNARRIC